MTIIIPDVGEEALLERLTGENMTLHLYTNDVTSGLTSTQIEALVAADFTEATFTGYASAALTGGSWTVTGGDPSEATYARQDFASTADQTPQDVYGYYVTRTSDGTLLLFEAFDALVTVEFNGDEIRITPRLTLADTQD